MIRIIFILALMSLFFVIGCAGPNEWISADLSPIIYSDTSKYIKSYELGKEKTAYIGQEIIKVREYLKGKYKKINVATTKEEIHINTRYGGEIVLNANEKYFIDATLIIDGKLFYIIKIADKYWGIWGILIDNNAMLVNNSLYSYHYKMIYSPIKNIIVTPSTCKFNVQETFIPSDDSAILNYELIYSGKNDVSLNVTYREYTGDNLARPAFFQNLTYQPNAKQLRFKNFLIQVHSVTNEHITYTIIDDGLN